MQPLVLDSNIQTALLLHAGYGFAFKSTRSYGRDYPLVRLGSGDDNPRSTPYACLLSLLANTIPMAMITPAATIAKARGRASIWLTSIVTGWTVVIDPEGRF